MSRRYKYLFTEEWWEGGKAEVSAYGKRKRSEIDTICDQMDRYSPYDYACPQTFDNESDYLSALQARINDGCKVKYYVSKAEENEQGTKKEAPEGHRPTE